MITSMGQRKIEIKPGAKLNHNTYRNPNRLGACLLWVMSTEISVDIAVDIAVDSRSI